MISPLSGSNLSTRIRAMPQAALSYFLSGPVLRPGKPRNDLNCNENPPTNPKCGFSRVLSEVLEGCCCRLLCFLVGDCQRGVIDQWVHWWLRCASLVDL